MIIPKEGNSAKTGEDIARAAQSPVILVAMLLYASLGSHQMSVCSCWTTTSVSDEIAGST